MWMKVLSKTSSALLALCVLASSAQQKYRSFDPGHKSFVTLGETRLSCPNGFTPLGTPLSGGGIVMQHDRFKLALFVARTEGGAARQDVERVATGVTKQWGAEAGQYRWKAFNSGDRKQSAYETEGGRLQGYNGRELLGVAYRELTVGGKTFLLGYVFDLHGGADAGRLLEEDLGGDSLLGAIAETHVICSITGEQYDVLNPNDGGVGGAPALP
jgi:hypothetical protein